LRTRDSKEFIVITFIKTPLYILYTHFNFDFTGMMIPATPSDSRGYTASGITVAHRSGGD
jgi:hypothetical protein